MKSLVALRSTASGAVFVTLAFLSLGCARGEERTTIPPEVADSTDRNAARAPELIGKIPAGPLAERFVAASALFLGALYQDGPLGEGDVGGPDPDPRVDFDRGDCVTYLEQSLALALCAGRDSATTPSSYVAALDRIRYQGGKVGFATRNHYMERDWAPANEWLVEDVTDRLAPGVAQEITRTIDRAKFLRDKGVEPRPGVDDEAKLTMRMIPRESLAPVAQAIASGDLIFWAGKKDGIDIVHTGLAVRDAQGRLLFRHASSKAGKVAEEPLADYAARATFTSGFLVLRPREDAH